LAGDLTSKGNRAGGSGKAAQPAGSDSQLQEEVLSWQKVAEAGALLLQSLVCIFRPVAATTSKSTQHAFVMVVRLLVLDAFVGSSCRVAVIGQAMVHVHFSNL
jgi:hypothetical protein